MGGRFEAFEDDRLAVPDAVILYRRVDWDKVGGRERCPGGESPRLTKNAFGDYSRDKAVELGYPGPCMSVAVSSIMLEQGQSPADLLIGFEGYGLAGIPAADLRGLERKSGNPCPQGIMLAATPKEPWHAVVFSYNAGMRSDGDRQAIADKAFWEVPLINE
jgi:hypothetical protein